MMYRYKYSPKFPGNLNDWQDFMRWKSELRTCSLWKSPLSFNPSSLWYTVQYLVLEWCFLLISSLNVLIFLLLSKASQIPGPQVENLAAAKQKAQEILQLASKLNYWLSFLKVGALYFHKRFSAWFAHVYNSDIF